MYKLFFYENQSKFKERVSTSQTSEVPDTSHAYGKQNKTKALILTLNPSIDIALFLNLLYNTLLVTSYPSLPFSLISLW